MPVVHRIYKEATPEQLSWRARIAHNEKSLYAAFLAWVDAVHAQITDSTVATAIITRSAAAIEHVLQAVTFQPVFYPVALDEAERAFEDVVRQVEPSVHLSFNLHDPNFTRAVQDHEARLVREVTGETRRAITNVIERGYASGVHPYVLAPQIREMVGLTSHQANAVMNFAEAQRKAGRSPQVVADRAIRYARKMRTRRAQTIGRTETARAATTGRIQGYLDAGAQGLFNTATAELEWSSVQDDAEEICAQLDGERVPLGEDFAEGMPPVHPCCRCSVFLALDDSTGFAKEYNPDEPRDDDGRWTSGGGGGLGGGAPSSLQDVKDRNPRVEMELGDHQSGITVSMIRVAPEDRGTGQATAAMNDLTRYADSQNRVIALTPESVGSGGLSNSGLTRWYRGFGFVPNRGANADYSFTESMIRQPQG